MTRVLPTIRVDYLLFGLRVSTSLTESLWSVVLFVSTLVSPRVSKGRVTDFGEDLTGHDLGLRCDLCTVFTSYLGKV